MDVLDLLSSLSNDEVFTPPKIAREMIDLLGDEIWERPDLPDMRFLDPACKTGVFLRELARKLIPALMRHPRFEEYSDNHDVMGNTRPEVEMPWLSVREHFVRKHVYTKMLYGIAISKLTAMISKKTLYLSKDANSGRHCITKGWFESEDGNIWNPWGYVETGEFDEEWGKPISRYEQKIQHTPAKPGESQCQHCGANISNYQDESKDNHAYAFIHQSLEEIFPHLKNEEGKVVFDIIIGNPPYQLATKGGNAQAKPLYNLFFENSIRAKARLISMITPSRWFSGGIGLNKHRDLMCKGGHVKNLTDFENVSDCFPNVSISGGVNYFLWDRSYNGLCNFEESRMGEKSSFEINLASYDFIVRRKASKDLIDIVRSKCSKFMSGKVQPINTYNIPSYERGEDNPKEGYLKFYSSKGVGYIDSSKIKNADSINCYRVAVGRSVSGSNTPGRDGKFKVFSKIFILKPGEVCSHSYLVVSSHENIDDANKSVKYLETKFFRYLLQQSVSGIDLSASKFCFVPDIIDDLNDINDDSVLEFFDAHEFKDEIKRLIK